MQTCGAVHREEVRLPIAQGQATKIPSLLRGRRCGSFDILTIPLGKKSLIKLSGEGSVLQRQAISLNESAATAARTTPPSAGKQTRLEGHETSATSIATTREAIPAGVQRMDDWQATSLLGAMGLSETPSLQRKGEGDLPDGAHEIATAGLAGAADTYPHRAEIEASFGQPITATAAIGGEAASACEALNASAYTRGNQVGFASAPDLRLAAHEAAHTLQQQQGVQLQAGLGAAGDRYERAADEAADLAVRGESAAQLFGDGGAGRDGAGRDGGGVQRQQITPTDPGGWRGVVQAIRPVASMLAQKQPRPIPSGRATGTHPATNPSRSTSAMKLTSRSPCAT